MDGLEKRSKKEKYLTLAKNMILFAISSFGSKIMSFLFVPLYTYVLSTQEYGSVDLLTSTTSLLIPVLSLNIQDAVLRFTLDNDYKSEDVISTGVRINLYGIPVLLLGVCFFKVIGIVQLSDKWFVFLIANYMLGAFKNCFTLYLKGREKVHVLMVSGLLHTFFGCTFNVLLLLVIKLGVDGYLIANTVGLFIAVIYQLFVGNIYKEIHLFHFQDLSKKMVLYSFPLIANSLAWWVNNASDRYILTFMCGIAINGIYSVAYKIPTILSTVQSLFYNAWSISAITEFDEKDTDGFIGNMYSLYSCCSIIVCSVILLFNIPIAKILYAKDFYEAWKYVPFLLVGTVFNGMALFQGCIFTAVKKTKIISGTTIIGAVVNSLFNVILIYKFEAIGAGLATLIGYLTTWIMRTIKLNEIVKIKIDWKKHLISCILIILQAFVALNSSFVVVQGIIIILLVFFQKDVFRLIKY